MFHASLQTYAYSNAAQDDLWEAYDTQAHADGVLDQNVDVKTIMDTWTLQKGYPVLDVRQVPAIYIF
jgi:aminopeptidase N